MDFTCNINVEPVVAQVAATPEMTVMATQMTQVTMTVCPSETEETQMANITGSFPQVDNPPRQEEALRPDNMTISEVQEKIRSSTPTCRKNQKLVRYNSFAFGELRWTTPSTTHATRKTTRRPGKPSSDSNGETPAGP